MRSDLWNVFHGVLADSMAGPAELDAFAPLDRILVRSPFASRRPRRDIVLRFDPPLMKALNAGDDRRRVRIARRLAESLRVELERRADAAGDIDILLRADPADAQ